MDDNRTRSNSDETLTICVPGIRRNLKIEERHAASRGSAVDSFKSTLLSIFKMSALLLLIISSSAFCRETHYVVKGKVIDASTDEVLPFANIAVENTNLHANTNEKGEFTFAIPVGESRLVVSYVGYKTEIIEVSEDDPALLVRLTPVNYLMQEVSVLGKQNADDELHSIRLGSAAIEHFAGITRDPMRALQLMPGVSTNDEASAKMDVRGGTWDENTVLIDGAEVYDPYHLKEVSLASIGIFNEDMVKNIDFSAGGFGAKYGDALSSVTSVHYKEGNRERLEGSINLSPLDLSATFQGPITDRSSFILAGRGSYLGYMLKNFNVGEDIYAGYYDLQGDIIYHTSETSKVQVDFLYSKDDATQTPYRIYSASSYYGTVRGAKTLISRRVNEVATFDGHYSNSLLSASYENVFDEKLSMRTLAYYTGNMGRERPTENTDIAIEYGALPELWAKQQSVGDQSYDLAMKVLSLEQEIRYDPFPSISLNAGVGVKSITYDYDPNMYSNTVSETNVPAFPDTTVSNLSEEVTYHNTTTINAESYEFAGFLQQQIRFADNLVVTPGLRFDYFDLDKEGRFSPRASFSYLTPFGVELNGAWGIYYQLPTYDQLKMSVASTANTQFQEATHYVVGIEKEFTDNIDLRVQFYQKYYSDLVPVIRLPYGGLFYDTKQNDGAGFAKGFDLQYRMNVGDMDMSISYSYLVSKEKSGDDPNYYPRISDQRHTASVALIYKPWNDWTIDIRGFYGSGYAYTPSAAVVDSVTMIGRWVQGADNSAHYPAYERLDVRITKAFTVVHSPLQLFVDVTNVFNRKNVWAYRYTYDSKGNLAAEPLTLLGIVPTIGINYRFGL